jgi:hypothetical protein
MFVASITHLFWNSAIQLLMHLNLDDRQRQWGLSAFNATLMSLYGVLLFPQWLFFHDLTATAFTDHVAKQLQAYMIVDLCYNTLMRNDAIYKPLEFWAHHSVYAVLMAYAVNGHYTGLVAAYLMMEIPAAIRAWGTLVPAWRTDSGFGTAFFLTRIVLSFLIFARDYRMYPAIACSLFAAMQTLHIYWFYLWCRSQMPRILAAALGVRENE